MNALSLRLGLLSAALFGALAAGAQAPRTTDDIASSGGLTIITSDRLTYDSQQEYALFERNVVVSDPSLKLKADKLTVRFAGQNAVTRITAEGNVALSQADMRAWAGKADYDLTEGKIVMEDQPRIMRGRDLLSGDRITYWRDQNRMLCEPRARLIINPESGAAKDLLPAPKKR